MLTTLSYGQKSQETGIVNLLEDQLEINGSTYTFESGHLMVNENHENQGSRIIGIPFKRIRTRSKNPLPPVFLLEGGPANTNSIQRQWKNILPILSSFTQRSDLVVLEQRGNGDAFPNLQCPGSFSLSNSEPLTKEKFGQEYVKYISTCEKYWQQQGINPGEYHVVSMAKDIEALRSALGYEQIMLFGGSFGSHWALNYLKLYPQNVERVLIDSPEGYDHSVKLPSYAEEALISLSDLVAADPVLSEQVPNFYELAKQVAFELKQPKTVKTSNGQNIILGLYDLQLITALDLGRSNYRALPYHYLQMSRGNYIWLADRTLELRRGLNYNLMAVIADCTSGASPVRWLKAEETSAQTVLGDALNNINFEACSFLDIAPLGEKIRVSITSEVPILVIVGSQDARTPLSNALEILSSFPNGRLLEVKNASHDVFQESSEVLFPLIRTYLSREDPMYYPDEQFLEVPPDLMK